MSESVQQMIRPGKCVDLYYPDPQTAEKACFATTVNTRFVQQFTNLSGGSSQFVIPPTNGVQDLIATMEIPAGVNASPVFDGRGLALPRGWGYSAIKQISYRYGGSSTFFLTKQQIIQAVLRKAANSGSRDDLLSLGGNAAAGGAAAQGDFATPQRAYVWLPLPHCVPTSISKLPPFSSDLLTQQILVTLELEPIASIFSAAAGAAGTPASSLSFGEFQVQMVMLSNQGDALARRVDMTTNALSYPFHDWTQQEVIVPLANATAQSLSLTGFRAGECRNIQLWITKDSDTSGNIKNPFKWYAPEDLVTTYAGQVYARFDKGSGALWNLVNGRQSSAVNEVLVADAGGGACSITTPFLARWVEVPFAQNYNPETAHSMYTAGLSVTNGIINLEFNLPTGLAPAADYKLHAVYNYNGVAVLSQGSAEIVV